MNTMNEWMASEKVANDNNFPRIQKISRKRSENIVITSIQQPFA